MEKASFLGHPSPLLTVMAQAATAPRAMELMERGYMGGAEAFGLQFCRMKAEYKTPETFASLFAAARGLPVYVTNYRQGENEQKTDDTLATEILELAECGATLCDVMGDLFDPTVGELTKNPLAVDRQKDLINRLHAAGAQVLMSSHVMRFLPAEQVLEIALAQQSRGADICKIVVSSSNLDEQAENMNILRLLARELEKPFLFLSIGESRLLRRLGEKLGNCMTLCVCEHDDLATPAQPLLSDMIEIRKLL